MIGSLKIRWKEKYLPIFLLVVFCNWTLDNYAALIGVIVRKFNCYLAINIVIFVTKYWLMHLHQSHARYTTVMYFCSQIYQLFQLKQGRKFNLQLLAFAYSCLQIKLCVSIITCILIYFDFHANFMHHLHSSVV